MTTTRRGFICGCSAAVAAMAGSRLSLAAFAPSASVNRDVLVVIFLRGGMDGLNVVAPLDGPDRGLYESARPELMLPASGTGAMLPLDAQFGMNAAAAPLQQLFVAGKLAIVHAVGMNVDSRSHFDCQEFVELGTPGVKATSTGWLARHLQCADNIPAATLMPSMAVGNSQPTSLLGNYQTVAMNDPGDFDIDTGPWEWRDGQRLALRRIYSLGSTPVHVAGVQAMNAMDLVEAFAGGTAKPSNGAVYPDSDFGRHMALLGQMIKLDIGLRVAAIDLGGWDTHQNEAYGGGQGYFADLLGDLAHGMAALYTDLDGSAADAPARRLTVVVQSEFGRRVRENADRGTDHGHGNPMLVLGGQVAGGFHGTWPGLAPDQLYDGADVAVTTDYRRVLSEVIIRRLANPRLSVIFPGYSGYAPLGVVSGPDLAPV